MTSMASKAPAKGTDAAAPGGVRGFVGTNQQWISLVMRLLLAVMWFNYSIGKLGSPESNAQSVRDFRILPESLVTPFGYAQPYFEMALGMLLILGLGTRLVGDLLRAAAAGLHRRHHLPGRPRHRHQLRLRRQRRAGAEGAHPLHAGRAARPALHAPGGVADLEAGVQALAGAGAAG